VVNGDALVWQDLWAGIAARFGMAVGPDEPQSLTQTMPPQEAAWAALAARHGLRSGSLQALVGSSWQFTDRAFAQGVEHPALSVLSPIKLRQHGFAGCYDTEDALHHWLDRMQAERLLPR
ncbi:MAG TPA: short-chain dehydrogenase, partial [Burkholderiaceae bacterium]|nr:short-chain dehydrogenase [Burkholderiaceae bacterium]